MMNRKWLAGALATCLVLGSTSVALANPDRGSGKAPAAATTQAPTDRTVQEKGRSAARHEQVAALKQELAKLRDMQRQANELRHQLNSEWSGLRQAIGQAMDANQVDLLQAKLPELQAVRTNLRAAYTEQEQERVETQGFGEAKQSGDVNAAMARIQAAEARVQARIDALQTALDSMKQLSTDIQAQLATLPTQTVTDDQEQDGQAADQDRDVEETQTESDATDATTTTTDSASATDTTNSDTTSADSTSTVTP